MYANKCISNQIFTPLKTINLYVDILIRCLQQRPEYLNMLEAIKYCNRMIQFSIYDLQARFKVVPNAEPNIEVVDVREVINDTVTFNKVQAHQKK